MELFFMMTAMLALIVPIAVGRVRCILIVPRRRRLFNRILSTTAEIELALKAGAIVSMSGVASGRPDRPAQSWAARTASISAPDGRPGPLRQFRVRRRAQATTSASFA